MFELIEYTDLETVFEAYVVRPPQLADRRPAVLLAHDWSGLHPGMHAAAARVAALGYVCFALDLYGKGVRGDPSGDNAHLMNPLLADRGLLRRRLLAGIAAATSHPAIDASRIAILGYCFGGLCALDLARAAPAQLAAAVSVHGVLRAPALGPQSPITARILVLHGWEDPFAPPGDVVAVAAELTAAGADWRLHAFGHALHAFTFEGLSMPERGLAYHPVAAREAWAALRSFLAEALG